MAALLRKNCGKDPHVQQYVLQQFETRRIDAGSFNETANTGR